MLSEILAEFLSKKNEAILFMVKIGLKFTLYFLCLLYTSDAADE